jgi:CoA-transferase family III
LPKAFDFAGGRAKYSDVVRDEEPGPPVAARLLDEIWDGLGGDPGRAVGLQAGGSVPSVFPASDLAQAAVAAAGLAVAELVGTVSGDWPEAQVDRTLASAWFVSSYRPLGWAPPAAWDPLGGDFLSGEGWIRLHTNAPHHRKVALDVLGVPPDREAVAGAVGAWKAGDLEEAVVQQGGAAAAMRTREEWAAHPQGAAVAAEPIVQRREVALDGSGGAGRENWWTRAGASGQGGVEDPAQPLAGLRILDLTRVLAGPVATRFLAGWGAEVLRIDPPDWDEPPLVPDITVGKRCARIDLQDPTGRRHLLDLLASADVVVHGYRPGALDRLGLGEEARRQTRPGIVDVGLDAYGWTGPWATRRGFDSLVQMSSGIAEAGMRAAGADRPVPLPFQALDHGTGYLLAASVLRGLTLLIRDGVSTTWRTSLARTAALLASAGGDAAPGPEASPAIDLGFAGANSMEPIEHTAWGDLRRLPSPVRVGGHGLAWSHAARPLGTDEAAW